MEAKKPTEPLCVAFLDEPDAHIAGTKWATKLFAHIPHKRVAQPGQADILVLMDMTTNDHAKNEAILRKQLALRRGKPLLVFLHDDPSEPMNLSISANNVLILRTSVNRSTLCAYEQLLPSFQAADLEVKCLAPAACLNVTKPFIGFCGVGKWPSRKAACDVLNANSALFDLRFIFRYDHHTRQNKNDQATFKREFEEVMTQCPYQICCRGCGNFSHRFFETLASGRIPVLIDTDTVLPPHVPKAMWERCIVMSKTAEDLPKDILAFHAKHDVALTQIMCRNLWQSYLSIPGYATYMEKQIKHLV